LFIGVRMTSRVRLACEATCVAFGTLHVQAYPKPVHPLSTTVIHPKLQSFEVMLPSACSFIVDGLTFSCRCSTLHAFGLHGHLQNLKTYWTIQCSRMLKYNITKLQSIFLRFIVFLVDNVRTLPT
jgi:hypothetical protein